MLTWSVAPYSNCSRRLIRLGTDRYPFFDKLRVRCRRHLNLLYTLHHYSLAGLQALGDDPIGADPLAHFDRPEEGLILGRYNQDLIERLHLDNRRLRYEQRVLLLSRL